MRAGGGKAKGSEFERDICKKLSRWVSHGEREDLFWRSAMSGGRATVGRKKGLDHAKHAGDISATHPDGHKLTDLFYIECKYYADLKFDSWILNGEGPLAGFWKVAREQAADHKLLPMLIVKQNRSDVFMIVPAPYILAPGSAGLSAFNPLACVARIHRQAKADVFLFDSVMVKPFAIGEREVFLKPGEINHILAKKPMSAKTEAALKSVISAATKTWSSHEQTERRRDGVKKRMMQEEPDGEISNTAGAPAKAAKPLRVKV